jgi:hypothetical protein
MWGRARAHQIVAAIALGIAALAAAPSWVSANTVTVSVGGRDIVIVIDPDQCELDRNHPSDSRVYDLVERGLAGRNELLFAAADCDQIGPWRSGQRPTLDDFTQVQVELAYRSRDLSGREAETTQGICRALRQHGSAAVTGPVSAVRDRFNSISETVKLNETKFIGVVHEDPEACYASLVQRVRTEHGHDKLILSVFAHVVVRGRLLYIYRYTQGESFASMMRLTDMLRKSVEAHLDANR